MQPQPSCFANRLPPSSALCRRSGRPCTTSARSCCQSRACSAVRARSTAPIRFLPARFPDAASEPAHRAATSLRAWLPLAASDALRRGIPSGHTLPSRTHTLPRVPLSPLASPQPRLALQTPTSTARSTATLPPSGTTWPSTRRRSSNTRPPTRRSGERAERRVRLGRARLTRRSCIRLPLPAPLWLARYGAVPSAAATAEATRSCELNGMQSGRGGDVLCCEGREEGVAARHTRQLAVRRRHVPRAMGSAL